MKYNPPTYGELSNTGYVQDGYDPVLSFDQWKSTLCVEHTSEVYDRLATIDIPYVAPDCVCTIQLSVLRDFVESSIVAGAVCAKLAPMYDDVFDADVRGYELSTNRSRIVPREYVSYRQEYRAYVDLMHKQNRMKTEDETNTKSEMALYRTLFKKYGPLGMDL